MRCYFHRKKTEWETPQWLFDELNKEFGFTLDVCALPGNAKCEVYFTPEDDGLYSAPFPSMVVIFRGQ